MECPECKCKDPDEIMEDDCELIITLRMKDKDTGAWTEVKVAIEGGTLLSCQLCFSEFFQRGTGKPMKLRRV